MNFLPMKTVYKCAKGKSTSLTDLAFKYKRLTLSKGFVRHRFQKNLKTPFTQIGIVPFEDATDDSWEDLMGVRRWDVFEGRGSLLTRMRATLKDTLATHWTPGGYHAVLHSSGLDSRCLSWLLRELANERGDEWLGTVVFLCSKWEGPSFKAIMEYQGWEDDQYLVPFDSWKNNNYYEGQLTDFDNAWRWSDGASPIAVNLFWYPVVEAINRGLLPDDLPIQTWTGQWGNTVLDAGSSDKGVLAISKIVSEFYNSTLCQRPMYGDEIIHGYATVELAKVVSESSIRLGKKLRPYFCEFLDSKLRSFTNLAADGDRHRPIAPWILHQIMDDYTASWYGKNIAPDVYPVNKNTEFHGFWYHWSLASFCQELRRRGIEVR